MLVAGSVIAKFKADITELQKGISQVKNSLGGLKERAGELNAKLKESFTSFMTVAKIAGAVAVGGFLAFTKSAIDLKNETDKAIITLDIIAERFGQSGKEAQKLAVTLGKELRIGTGSASDALQNLLKSGLNLNQASDLLKRFANEAMTGKSSSISLSDAVKNLSFSYATNNSAIGNLSGISENYLNIIEKGKTVLQAWNGTENEKAGITKQLADQIRSYEDSLKSQGKTLDKSSDETAKYIGMLQLTNLTLGSSERFQGSFIDNMAVMQQRVDDVKLALAERLLPVLNEGLKGVLNSGIFDIAIRGIKVFSGLIENFVGLLRGEDLKMEFEEGLSFFVGNEGAKQIMPVINGIVASLRGFGSWVLANKDTVIAFLQGLAIAITGLVVIGTIVGLVTALTNPIFLLITAVGLLYTAWQTNFMGIQDITQKAITYIQQALDNFKNFWTLYGDDIMLIITGVWSVVVGVFEWAFNNIMFLFKFFSALFRGDFGAMWQAIKDLANNQVKALGKIFWGLVDIIKGSLGAMVTSAVGYFQDLWNKAKEYAEKIKKALDKINPFHKESPSLVEWVQNGTSKIAEQYRGLADTLTGMDFKTPIMDIANGMNITPMVSTDGAKVINQNIYATINDGLDINTLAERLAFKYRNSNL